MIDKYIAKYFVEYYILSIRMLLCIGKTRFSFGGPSPEIDSGTAPAVNKKEQFMSIVRRLCAVSLFALVIFAVQITAPHDAFAQKVAVGLPDNAEARRYGNGWECKQGYQKVRETCVKVKVPKNGYLSDTSFGRGWECSHGYRDVNDKCIVIGVPRNGYLDSGGDRWECDRGFLKAEKSCAAIKVPKNGYLADATSGAGWACERGYRATKQDCVAVKVPANGILTDSTFGAGWVCGRGYQATENDCVALAVPKNAHIDYSGNEWVCDRPYEKNRDKCEFPTADRRL